MNDLDDWLPPLPLQNPKLKRAQSLVGTSAGRPVDDFYRTPRSAVEALLSVETFVGDIWECACGDGAISTVLEEYGHTVMSTDLIDRGYGTPNHNFLDSILTCTNIVTNPPYNLAEQFVDKALSVTTGKVCLLVKLAFLEGQKRKTMFQSSPLARVHVFSKRLSMYRNGEQGGMASGMIAFQWMVFDHSHVGPPTLGWL